LSGLQTVFIFAQPTDQIMSKFHRDAVFYIADFQYEMDYIVHLFFEHFLNDKCIYHGIAMWGNTMLFSCAYHHTAVKTYVLTLTKCSRRAEHGGVTCNPWGAQEHDSGKSRNWCGIVVTIFKVFACIIMFRKGMSIFIRILTKDCFFRKIIKGPNGVHQGNWPIIFCRF